MPETMTTTSFLFVYGTLMKGFQADWPSKVGARLVGRGKISAKLYDLGDYPGAVYVPGDSGPYVKGELYQLRNPELANGILDQYEEFFPGQPDKSLFVRTVATVRLEEGRREKAWVYFYNRPVDEARFIPSGDYRDKVSARG